MQEPTAEERAKLESIFEGLALAVSRSGELGDDSVNKIGDVKLEKFVYKALNAQDELDEVTHSWYLAGAKTDVPNDSFTTDDLKTAFDRVTGPSGSTDEFIDHQSNYTPSPAAEAYAEYFTSDFDLEGAWFTYGEYYLLDFYKEETPAEYRELYIASQKLRNLLNTLVNDVREITSNDQTGTLADFGQTQSVTGPSHYDEIAEQVSKIHLELAKDEQLKDVLPEFRMYTDLLEDACLALEKMEVERIGDPQLRAFKDLRSFHFYKAWKLPSLIISTKTAEGPRSDELRVRHIRELEQCRESFPEKFEEVSSKCKDATLTPTVEDYSNLVSEDELLDELIERYVRDNE